MQRFRNEELRVFGLALSLGLAVVALRLNIRSLALFRYFFIASVLFMIIAVIRPDLLKPLNKAMRLVFDAVSGVVGWVALLGVFLCIVTPLGFLARIKKAGSRNRGAGKEDTFWIRRKGDFLRENYKRQF
jgi:hypothetical protein